MREGFFGVKEYSNSQILLERQVDKYNKASSNLNTAALNTLKKSMSLGPQVRSDVQSMTGKELMMLCLKRCLLIIKWGP